MKYKTILFNNDLDPYLQILLEHAGYISLTATLIHKLSSSSAEACWMRQTEFIYRVCILIQGVKLKLR